MLQILNKTPLEAALAPVTDQNGVEIVTVAVKGTFVIPARGQRVRLAEKQLSPLYADEYYGEPGKSSIKYPADLILGKVSTDIGVVGNAHSPTGKPVTKLPVSLRVGQLKKGVLVVGDRKWEKRGMFPGFHVTDPIPFTAMPLVYERAFGGVDKTHKDERKHNWDQRNPIGTGFRVNSDAVEGHSLPNIEDPNHPISTWKDKPPIAGLGFIDASWEPRVEYAGTYDDDWQQRQFPLLPLDFDYRFFNCANPDLTAKSFLQGGEQVQMVNFSKKGVVEFSLPKIEINLMFRLGETRNHRKGNLWTVIFEPGEDRFSLVWGASLDVGKQPSRMRYVKVEMEGETSQLN